MVEKTPSSKHGIQVSKPDMQSKPCSQVLQHGGIITGHTGTVLNICSMYQLMFTNEPYVDKEMWGKGANSTLAGHCMHSFYYNKILALVEILE
jgi:hypothetical protein